MASYLEPLLLGSTNSGLLKEPNAVISTGLVTQSPVGFSLVTLVYTQSHMHLNIILLSLLKFILRYDWNPVYSGWVGEPVSGLEV